MAKVRTYTGKLVDFDEIIRGHEKEQAVGNANMNARGDVIDDKGRIKQSKEDRSREYNKNVSNSVIKSSLLDEVDDLPDTQNTKKKTASSTAKQTPPKSAPKKSTISEDFEDVEPPVKNDKEDTNSESDNNGDKT